MFKRLSVIAAVFFLLAAFINPVFAGKLYDEKIAIDDALQNYDGYYKPFSQEVPGQDQSLHYITDTSLSKIPDANGYGCGFLTYGQPHGEQKDGQYRYIGYTFYGEDYTNMDFPPDRYANGADFASQNWVSHPWDDPAVKASNPNIKKFDPVGLPGDGDSDIGYRYVLQYSILFTDYLSNNGYKVDLSSNPSFWDNIHLYVHVLSPATTYSWGIGRMWHKDEAGNLWYITIPIASSILIPPPGNLKAVSLDLGVPAGQKAEPGAEYTATVVFENESEQAYPGTPVAVLHGDYQATLYDETGQPLPKKVIGGKEVQVADFDKKGTPGAKRTFTCRWHPFNQPTDGLTGMVNRDEIGKVHQEVTYDDNIISQDVQVNCSNYDIKVQIESGMPGKTVWSTSLNPADMWVNVHVTRKDSQPGTLPVRLTIDGPAGRQVIDLPAFEQKDVRTYYWKAYTSGSDYTVTAQAWPSDGSWEDVHPPDNTDSITITYECFELKPLDGKIRGGLIDTEY